MAESITTSYSGEFSKRYKAAALLSAPTLDKGTITILPNVRHKTVLQKVASTNILVNATCNFDDATTVTLTEAVLETKELNANVQLCKKTFRASWQAAEMGYSQYSELPKDFASFMVAHVTEKIASSIESSIWNGDKSVSGQFDGFKTLMLLDSTVNDVTGTTITTANCVTELQKIYDAIPNTLFGSPDLRIYCSSEIIKHYVAALGGFSVAATSNNGVQNNGTMWYNNGELSFNGVALQHAPGMAANCAIAAESTNLFYGCALESNAGDIRVIDMGLTDGSDNVRIVARVQAGVQYAIGADCVLYS